MLRLRVQILAKQRGLSLNRFAQELQLPTTSARRVWFSSSDGSEHGGRLRHIDLELLERLADYFQVGIGDLFERVSDDTAKVS